MPEILIIILILVGIIIGAFTIIQAINFFKKYYSTKKTPSSPQSLPETKNRDDIYGPGIHSGQITIDIHHNPAKSFDKSSMIDQNKHLLPPKNFALRSKRPHLLLRNDEISTEREAVLTPCKIDPETKEHQPLQQEESQRKKQYIVLYSNIAGESMTPEKKLNSGEPAQVQDDGEENDQVINDDEAETNWFRSLRLKGQEEVLLSKQIKALKEKKKESASNHFIRV